MGLMKAITKGLRHGMNFGFGRRQNGIGWCVIMNDNQFIDFDRYVCTECGGKPDRPRSQSGGEWEYRPPVFFNTKWHSHSRIKCEFCRSYTFKPKRSLETDFNWKSLKSNAEMHKTDDEAHVYLCTDIRIEVILPATAHKEWKFNPLHMRSDVLFMLRHYAGYTHCPRCRHQINEYLPSPIEHEIICPCCKTSVDPISIIHAAIPKIQRDNLRFLDQLEYYWSGMNIEPTQKTQIESNQSYEENPKQKDNSPKNRWEALEI